MAEEEVAEGAGPAGMDLPPHVMDLAKTQAQHLEDVLRDANAAEEKRMKESRRFNGAYRERLEMKYDRERKEEVDYIQRLRQEHAVILSAAMRDELPDYQRVSGDFGKAKRNVGSTSKEQAFFTDMCKKLDGADDRAAKHQAMERQRQRAQSSRLSTSRTWGTPSTRSRPVDRRDLLSEKRMLLERLHGLVVQEERLLHDGTDRSSMYTGRSSYRSGGAGANRLQALSPRSVATSASAATFVTRGAPVVWKNTVPSNVPKLHLRR